MRASKRRRLLIVDDDESRSSVRSFFFRVRGFEVFVAASAKEAEKLVAEVKPDVALIALELNLGYSGAEVVRWLKDCDEDLGLMLVSLLPSPVVAHVADSLFGSKHEPAELLEAVRLRALRKRGPKKAAPDVEAVCA